MHPCCGGSLQTGTKVVAIVNMVLACILIVFGMLGTAYVVESQRNYDKAVESGETLDPIEVASAAVYGVMLAAYVILMVGGFVSLLFAVLLIIGAVKRNPNMCRGWFVFMAVNVVFTVINIFRNKSYDPGYVIAGRCGGILLHLYLMWIVWAFMSELKREREQKPSTQTLHI